jgi:hypothetical protein
MESIIEVFPVKINGVKRWKFRVIRDNGKNVSFTNYSTRDEAVSAAQAYPGNSGLHVQDISAPDWR